MRKILYTLLALMLALPVAAEDVEIQFDQLPEKAQKVVLKAFPDTKVKKVEMERRASLIQYEVKLAGGIKMQFNKEGRFTECECTKSAVPDMLIPEKIREYLKREFTGIKVMRIEHDSKLFDILLSNGYELTFNSSYRLIDIDRPEEE
ncbi:MAG: PepSY-like domain-containing protein [Bacteroidaceae bacterium]|nr:PepSY-like domain-containing protein [Bacteroidaceae bacterium]